MTQEDQSLAPVKSRLPLEATLAGALKKHGLKFSPRQLAWMRAYTSEDTPTYLKSTAAAIEAGYSSKCAYEIGKQLEYVYGGALIDHLNLKYPIERKLLKVLIDGLDATVTRDYRDRDGNLVERETLPDHANRHKFMVSGMKLKGMFPAEELRTHNRNVNENSTRLSFETPDAIHRDPDQEEAEHDGSWLG